MFKQAIRVIGQTALWTGAGIAGLFILGEAGKQAREEEEQRPPVTAEFSGHEETFTAPFTTNGPWQISWQGDIDIQVWMHTADETPVQYSGASGCNGSSFFPDAGTFFLVIGLFQTQPWRVTVRSR